MATIKAFTDIPQSQVLAKILPLESADMKWLFWKSEIDAPKLPTFGYSKDAAESYKNTEAVYLPCWSLAALLNIIGHYTLQTVSDSKRVIAVSENGNPISSFSNSQPVDACYELILKLNELNLL